MRENQRLKNAANVSLFEFLFMISMCMWASCSSISRNRVSISYHSILQEHMHSGLDVTILVWLKNNIILPSSRIELHTLPLFLSSYALLPFSNGYRARLNANFEVSFLYVYKFAVCTILLKNIFVQNYCGQASSHILHLNFGGENFFSTNLRYMAKKQIDTNY